MAEVFFIFMLQYLLTIILFIDVKLGKPQYYCNKINCADKILSIFLVIILNSNGW